jgi:RNA recognition motif-containing protein
LPKINCDTNCGPADMSRSTSISLSDSEASSSSSSSGPSSPQPKSVALVSKRKRTQHDDSGSDSESNSDDEDDEEVPTNKSMAVEDSENEGDEEEETPVLSHAERRRQKKKTKLEDTAEPSSSTTKSNQKQKVNSKTPKTGKSSQDGQMPTKSKELSVWVGNLAFKTTAQNLRDFFAGVGEITRINMPMRTGSKTEIKGCVFLCSFGSYALIFPYRFAYIDLDSAEAKAKAITYSEKPLLGRRLLIKDGWGFDFSYKQSFRSHAIQCNQAVTSLADPHPQ